MLYEKLFYTDDPAILEYTGNNYLPMYDLEMPYCIYEKKYGKEIMSFIFEVYNLYESLEKYMLNNNPFE